jgi:hypothetical protein
MCGPTDPLARYRQCSQRFSTIDSSVPLSPGSQFPFASSSAYRRILQEVNDAPWGFNTIQPTLVVLTEDPVKGYGKPKTPGPCICLKSEEDLGVVLLNGRQLEEVAADNELR